jgi:PAS domain S-box-containing protein
MIDADGRIVLVNREIERLFGYSREELLGKPVDLLVPEQFRTLHPRYRQRFVTEPKVRRMGSGRELFGRHKDGTMVAVEIGLTPVVTAEGVFILSAIVDITARLRAEKERVALEEELRQAQRLEAVGTLAGGIAHDFRNILNGIIGYAELVKAALDKIPDNEGATQDVDQLLTFAGRGRELVDRILTFSRRGAPQRHPLALQQQIPEVVRLLRATLPSSIEIQTELDESTPTILGDATSIHQVLMNLGTNAAHAMPQRGTLRIVLEPFYVRDSIARANPELREGPYALLTVRDSGIGIDPAVVDRVFDPFFTTKDPGSGTGLGLAMVHGIMRDHDGAVRISSELQVGTEVRCYFPAFLGEPEEGPATTAEPADGRGERILFVDDEPSLAVLGQRRLEMLGYTVAVATGSSEALELVRTDPTAFDLVITDYTMPGQNGVELAAGIAALRPGLPIILATGNIDDFPPDTMAAAGIHRVLLKPHSLDDLGRAVAEALQRRAE